MSRTSEYSASPNQFLSQQLLFPFDPLGGGPDPVVVLSRPVPWIARAVFAPVFVGFSDVGLDTDVHFFAVTDDGWNVLHGTVKLSDIARLPNGLQDLFTHSSAVKSGMSELDCMEAWLDMPRFRVSATGNCQRAITALARAKYGLDGFSIDQNLFIPLEANLAYERYIVQTINEKIGAAVSWVLDGLDPEVYEILTARPKLSLRTARALLQLAGTNMAATRYVTQALKTESLALLDLMVEVDPEIATHLVKTLLSGASLPCALLAIGISKAGHRRSLWSDKPEGRHFQLANIPMKGELYLRSQRVLTRFSMDTWPHDETTWQQFIGMVNALPKNFPESLSYGLMKYCWTPKVQAASRMLGLVETVTDLAMVAAKFGCKVSLRDAVDAIFSMHPNAKSLSEEEFQFQVIAKNRTGAISKRLSIVAELRLDTMASELLYHLPEIPDITHGGFQFHQLCRIDEITSWGIAAENCLREAEHVMSFLPLGVTMFSVRSMKKKEIVGTLAMKAFAAFFFHGVSFQEYQFEHPFWYINDSPIFLKTAIAAFIAGLNGSNNLEWFPFVNACEAWREKTGVELKG